MNQSAREQLIKLPKRIEDIPYTEEDFRELAKLLKKCSDTKGFIISNQFEANRFNPMLIETWSRDVDEGYDYHAIIFGPVENIPLILNEDLSEIDHIIINWRYDRC